MADVAMLHELKRDSDQWNLGHDAKLLEYLNRFSSNLSNKTKNLIGKIDELSFEVSETDVRLRNTLNEFIMLANTQFIENRVYDDDEIEDEPAKESKRSSDFIENNAEAMKMAYTLGLAALKFYYGDENPSNEKVEDIYSIRPLPYIIGTDSFIESDDAGLGETIDGPTHTNNFDGAKRHTINNEGVEEEEDEYYYDNSRDSNRVKSSIIPARFDEDSEEEEEEEEDEQFVAPKVQPKKQAAYDDDDDYKPAARIPLPPTKYDDDDEEDDEGDDEDEKPKMSIKDQLAAQIASRGGGAQPPSKQKQPSWDDDDEDDDADSNARPSPTKVQKSPFGLPIVLEKEDEDNDDDGDEDMFGKEAEARDDPFSLFGDAPSRMSRSGNKSSVKDSLAYLLSDSGNRARSDSDTSAAGSAAKKRPSFSALFGTANDNALFGDDEEDEPAPKSKAHANNAKKEKDAPVIIAQKEAPKKQDRSFEDLFGSIPEYSAPFVGGSSKSSSSSGGGGSGGRSEIKSMRATDLFGSGDDDLFGSSKTKEEEVVEPTKPTNSRASMKLKSLFDESDDLFLGSQSKPVTVKSSASAPARSTSQKKSSLFDDDEDLLQVKAGAPAAAAAAAAAVEKDNSMFDLGLNDDDDDDLFKPKAKAPIPAPAPAKTNSHFDLGTATATDDDDIFKPKAKNLAPAPAEKKKVASLFDSGDDEDDIFKPKAEALAPVEAPVAAREEDVAKMEERLSMSIDPRMSSRMSQSIRRPGTVDEEEDEEDDDWNSDDDKPKPAPAPVPVRAPAPAPALEILSAKIEGNSKSDDDDDDDSSDNEWNDDDDTPAKPMPAPAPAAAGAPTNTCDALRNERPASAISARMPVTGFDPSKIVMPGMAPPKGLGKKVEIIAEPEVEGGCRSRTSSSSISTSANQSNLERPVVQKSRRPPSKKVFLGDADDLLELDGPPASADPQPALASEPAHSPAPAPVKKGVLDDDDDLFGTKSVAARSPAPAAAATERKKSIFEDDDDDLFGKKPSPISAPKPAMDQGATKKKSLFDDDDEDDIFVPKSKDATASSSQKKSSLFDD